MKDTLARFLVYAIFALAVSLVCVIVGLGVGDLIDLAVESQAWRIYSALALFAWLIVISVAGYVGGKRTP